MFHNYTTDYNEKFLSVCLAMLSLTSFFCKTLFFKMVRRPLRDSGLDKRRRFGYPFRSISFV